MELKQPITPMAEPTHLCRCCRERRPASQTAIQYMKGEQRSRRMCKPGMGCRSVKAAVAVDESPAKSYDHAIADSGGPRIAIQQATVLSADEQARLLVQGDAVRSMGYSEPADWAEYDAAGGDCQRGRNAVKPSSRRLSRHWLFVPVAVFFLIAAYEAFFSSSLEKVPVAVGCIFLAAVFFYPWVTLDADRQE